MKLYRFENPYYFGSYLRLEEFEILKETPKGYWIDATNIIKYPYWKNNEINYDKYGIEIKKRKWVSKDCLRRYAHDTIEEALIAFKFRKLRQIKILKSQLRKAENAYTNALYAENNPDKKNIRFIKKNFRLLPVHEKDLLNGFIKEEEFLI